MIPSRRVHYGVLGSKRIVADFPDKHTPTRVVHSPTSDPVACLFLQHTDGKSGLFWIIDCSHAPTPEISSIPANVVPDSFAFYIREGGTHIVFRHRQDVFRIRFSNVTRHADPMTRTSFDPEDMQIVACTERGDVLFAKNEKKVFFNWHENIVYELSGDRVNARLINGSGAIPVHTLQVESHRELGAQRNLLCFASHEECVVAPAPSHEYPNHSVVPWGCKVHPHRPLYLRADGARVCVGSVRASSDFETKSNCDAPVRVFEWMDTDGYIAATDSQLHILFLDFERIGYFELVKEVFLYYLPYIFLFAFVAIQMSK